jgi:hypothetical protein
MMRMVRDVAVLVDVALGHGGSTRHGEGVVVSSSDVDGHGR